MNPKLQAKFLTMAAATLGLSLVGGCAKRSEPAAAEGGESASGAETSCGGNSCGTHHEGEKNADGVVGTSDSSTTTDTGTDAPDDSK